MGATPTLNFQATPPRGLLRPPLLSESRSQQEMRRWERPQEDF